MNTERALGGWWLSPHAARRAYERRISDHEIIRALNQPTSTLDQGPLYPGCELRRRGSIAIVVEPASKTIKTVLFAHQNLDLDFAPRRHRRTHRRR